MEEWDERFLGLAKYVSTWSKDPFTKVGAVIVDGDKRIVSIGYNGFPKEVDDDERLYDRDLKNDIVVHAEMNAMMFANRSLANCTLYTYPFMPCHRCAGPIIQSGIECVVSYTNENERYKDSFALSRDILTEAGVGVELYDDRS